jgi:hypothetical protein
MTDDQNTAENQVPWARQAPAADVKPVTDRMHNLVHGLPAWDPLPPGEILVRRPRE